LLATPVNRGGARAFPELPTRAPERTMRTMIRLALPLLLLATPALADRGDRITAQRLDRGDQSESRLDRRGDRH
jgi:hypothetical protein